MATYDFNLAKKIVQKYSDLLESAELGMVEDWYWTAEPYYCDGKFTGVEERGTVAGIGGSTWATPTIKLTFKDGTEKFLDCYEGCVTPEEKPEGFELGCLSSQVQEDIDIKRGKYIN